MTRSLIAVPLAAILLLSSLRATAAPQTATASVTLKVPVGATLSINGHPTGQMTGTRYFVTPELPVGAKYRYIFEATFTWNGEEIHKRKQLDLTVGSTYTVDMMVADTFKKPVAVEEPEVKPVVPAVERPKPAPPKVEPRPTPKVEVPKPAPKVEQPTTPKPQPTPAPTTPDKPKPKEPIAQPERQVAPKPREVKAKK
ncbi:TIGR03000 domain-containing protein [Limnoglobus roseus]|uniref:TIGR03000 domain-containing protein n=1 Tax=Limnoglobus roseus TaxID=2598579 RepID=A0A5C1AGN6_9BACT|nr:TIGR03000 domain-containing protein [Limnoglobus roseus]